MYTYHNYKTKKELKADAARMAELLAADANDETSVEFPEYRRLANRLGVYQPNNMFGTPDPTEGKVYIEGPHYPRPHSWYAEAWLSGGVIVKVK